MSYITDVILIYHGYDDGDFESVVFPKINSFYEGRVGLKAVPHECQGGSRYMGCEVMIGGMNYFDQDGFIRHLKGIAWDQDTQLTLIVCREQEERIVPIKIVGYSDA